MSAPEPPAEHVEVNQLPGMFAPVPEKSWCAADGQPWPCDAVSERPLTAYDVLMTPRGPRPR